MRPGLSSAAATAKRLAGIAVAMASVAMLPILAAAPVSALAETPTLGEPEHEKAAILNEDGTATVTLSVTGETASSQSKSSANVIVVLDTSGSMNDVVATRRVTGWEQVGR
jgi:Mg-chelatase subunit ChlD